ncbi:MAG: succinate dehydrogenase / fumarate reductase, cytochrome b subunit [Actinomycetota bacterium]|jgi:succinate dehydrogenase / fumarate reductase cytochrome b subunit|nr:succinate dehydrogenase / fumarate reductase, cytochrome b subunit [Actinomycetota bacterium]
MSPATTSTVYRGKSGQWAFILHRVTGFLVFMFLLLHVVDVSLINIDPDLYNEVHQLYGNVLLRLFEVGLLGALLFHAFNGLRIVMIDFFPGAIRNQKAMFRAVVFFTLILTAVGGYVILKPFIDGRIL